MQAAPSDDMFAGLTTNSSLAPPIGRLTTPTSTTPTTGGVNSTSGLDLSSLATTRLQTTSYQTPPIPRPSGSHLAPSVPLQPTPAAAAVLTPSPAVLGGGGGGTSWSPATAEEEEWAGHHPYCSQLQLAPPPTPLIACSLPVSSNQPSHHGAGLLVSTGQHSLLEQCLVLELVLLL